MRELALPAASSAIARQAGEQACSLTDHFRGRLKILVRSGSNQERGNPQISEGRSGPGMVRPARHGYGPVRRKAALAARRSPVRGHRLAKPKLSSKARPPFQLARKGLRCVVPDSWTKVREELTRPYAEDAPVEGALGADLSPAECELVAMRSLLADLVQAVEVLAPGRFNRALQLSRVRLNAIEAGRVTPAFPSEDVVLRHRVDIIERGQGRPPTQG
jgi:hypothetical protein